MTRYADPERCPDCHGMIGVGTASCPTCGLSLRGPTAGELFATLSHADDLLATLRAASVPGEAPTAVPAHAPATVPGVPPMAVPTQAPATPVAPGRPPAVPPGHRPAVPHRRGLSAASVPKILLSVGAACLLVAAIVFLAVTWSVLGVAGRTAVLVAFTLTAAALAGWMARRDLRGAAEALSLVGLGLLTLDLFGARSSGWLGDVTGQGFAVLLGAVLALTGAAAALAARKTPVRALVAPEVVAVLGVGCAAIGLAAAEGTSPAVGLVLAVLVSAAATALAQQLRLLVLAVGAAVVTGVGWLALTSYALFRAAEHDTFRELWLDLEVWPLLVAVALMGALALVRPLGRPARVAALGVAWLVLATGLTIPFAGQSSTALTLAVLALMALSAGLVWAAPAPWRWAGALTLEVGAVYMLGVGVALGAHAASRLLEAGAQGWAGPPSGTLPDTPEAPLAPWLLLVATVGVLGAVVVPWRRWADSAHLPGGLLPRDAEVTVLAALAATAVVGTVAGYPVPVWLVLFLALLAATTFTTWAVMHDRWPSLAAGTALLAGSVYLSWYDETLSLVALVVAALLSGLVHLAWSRTAVAAAAGAAFAATLTGLMWTAAALAGAAGTWASVAALLLLALVTLGAPALPDPWWRCASPVTARTGTEAGALLSAFVVAVAGLDGAAIGRQPTWAAVYLTLTGATVTAMALLRRDRRLLGWLGGSLLAAASWVRLWDIGVVAPEAYTLPSAVALGVLGLVRLRRDPRRGTFAALGPALGLGLVPSLLWVLDDPLTVRAAVLGVACLVLVVAGARLRWSAPLVLGATVGTVLVLRLATPVAEAVPRWVLIGAAGVLLVGMGVTWERRVNEAKAVLGYVRRLR